jgi:hypothetical protein
MEHNVVGLHRQPSNFRQCRTSTRRLTRSSAQVWLAGEKLSHDGCGRSIKRYSPPSTKDSATVPAFPANPCVTEPFVHPTRDQI